MSENTGTIEQVAAELAVLFEPLTRLASEGRIDVLPELLGLRPTDAGAGSTGLSVSLSSGGATATDLPALVADLVRATADDEAGAIAAVTASLLRLVAMVLGAMGDAKEALQSLANDPSLTPQQRAEVAAFADAFVDRLLSKLLVDYVEARFPHVAMVLAATGVMEIVREPGGPAGSLQAAHVRKTMHLDRLGKLFSDPAGLFKDVYGWGEPGFDALPLFKTLQTLVRDRFDIPAEILEPPGEPPLLEAFGFAAELDPALDPPGLHISIRVPAGLGRTQDIDLGDWTATFDTRATFAADLEGTLQPPFDAQLDLTSGAAEVDLSAIIARSADAPPVLLLGTAGGSRLELGQVSVTGGLQFAAGAGATADRSLTLEGELTGGRLVIDASSGDGFVATLLGGGRLDSRFGVGFSFSPENGLRFHGSGGLEIAVPVHLELGPVEVQTIYLAARLAGTTVPVELSAGLSAHLGPVQASVDRLGVVVTIGFPDGGGNLGPADLSFAFKPPNGIGLAIDAGLVAGGGYLFSDPDRGEYAGALELEFAKFLDLKAIGLISTRMPDGTTGFSLLVVITAEFGSGIQLGYGFTLLAVGGILGLNRGMNLQALGEGVRTGAIESVMFPQDVVANAPRILSDLRAFFPAEAGTFLVGPMAKIGWGTPTLVSVSMGVVVEIPGNLAILGVLRCVLPSKELSLLVLQVQFVGAIEFDRSRLWFFAQLFDSRVLTITLGGGMGLLVAWGDHPDLVVTVGGFHPSYRPPPLPFPVPDRITVDILNRPGALIRVSGYFAITSNTVQFGARAELRLGFDSFGIEGHLSFDALFQFSPFRFVIAISAGVSLKAFGVGLFSIDLRFQLEGPAPWRAHGRGSIGFLFFEISANFDITWGESRDTTLPPVNVLPLLAAEVAKVEGWLTRPPTGRAMLVTLRQLGPTELLVLHPSGTLVVRQRAIPLQIRLDRVGGQRVGDGRRFSLAPAEGSGLVRVAVTADKFAIAQFQDMSDAQKLSLPAYGDQDAGVELAGAAGVLASARVVRRSARYEMIVIDSRVPAASGLRATAARVRALAAAGPAPRRLTSVSTAVFGQLLAGSSTSRSVLSQQDAQRLQPFAAAETVQLPGQRFVVAYVRNNVQAFPPGADLPGTVGTPNGPEAGTFRSEAAAADALADWVAAQPSLAGTLHVIPAADASAPLAVPGSWTEAGDMPSATAWTGAADPATRLPGGRLLVAGGADAGGEAVATVALFDPVANRWSPGPALDAARMLHATAALANGRVLVCGGRGEASGSVLASAEVYDPLSNTWSATPSDLSTGRFGHSGTRLPNGSVLVAGGTMAADTAGGGGAAPVEHTLASTELFDPDTGEWTDGPEMTEARSGHQAVLLAHGRVLVVGGAVATGGRPVAMAYCELFDPATGEWTPTGELGTPRIGHQATLLPDGTVLVTGGDGRRAGRTYRPDSLDTAERYDPATGAWSPVAPMPGPRTRHRAVLLRTGRVLVTGGTGGPAFAAGYRSVDVYDPGADRWIATGALALGRWAHLTTELADGRVVVASGITRAGAAAPGPDPTTLTVITEVLIP